MDGKVLGHVFFSEIPKRSLLLGDTPPTPPPAPVAPSFPDVANDIYKEEIGQAVALGIYCWF